MEDRLKKLKKSQVSNQLEFTEQHRKNIYKSILRDEENEDEVLLAILQLLSKRKNGYELLQHLFARGMKKFEENEGSLYILLHDLEQKEFISSEWNQENVKQYFLNHKGHRHLRKMEAKQGLLSKPLKDLLQGNLSYE
ncbi:PadR family transcriptional regulator [Lederbergia lenta]|uniref:Lineage-specific thermal regulator protein n=1 Tax=Lederbergia lenta TaxID=1467 RepID=A0A2X4VPJ9_LEDLE|nr:PadR family transcriptional regulator [Lederbergia lenta]MCM3110970.1 PadR family transcriptional regulator [Lederbergia lenta]MEC2325634.1 PadR family transcriptional regulator [Lederbergia lenta]SQI54107.1 lineage-specific thermal regulator protein [Lederbergia lenta]